MPFLGRSTHVVLATLANIHPLLPGVEVSVNIARFQDVLETANISRIAFLRHGNTGASTTGRDFDRLLTSEGKKQAEDAGAAFGRRLSPFHSPALISSSPRTMATAKIFIEASGISSEQVEQRPVDILYEASIQPKGSALFRELGYSPLRDYLEHDDEQFRDDAVSVLGGYASSAIETAAACVEESLPSKAPATLLFVSHAVYLPATALAIASLMGLNELDTILNTNTGEAEGYLVDMANLQVEYLSRIQPSFKNNTIA